MDWQLILLLSWAASGINLGLLKLNNDIRYNPRFLQPMAIIFLVLTAILIVCTGSGLMHRS